VLRNRLQRYLGSTRAALRRARAAISEPRSAIDVELHSPWIQSFGFKTILDVGANEGSFAKSARSAFPYAQIFSFEPLPGCARVLEAELGADPRFLVFRCALGDHSGETHMFQNEYTASSSILAMAKTHVDAFPYTARADRITVPLRTLDDVVRDRHLATPALLKLDVRGYELKVLAGARDTLARVSVILLEVSLQQMYESAPVFDEVYRSLHDRGFTLRGIVDVLRRPADGRPLQVNLLFERS
jgi:FkbM family methyltransferase